MVENPYRDKRQEFFRGYFERGLSYDDYLSASDPNHQLRWREYEKRISLSEEQFKTVASFKRQMNVVVLSGVWCGDCARQGPILRRIEEANPCIRFRYLESRANRDLQEELRINGAEKVPVVVVLSEDFYEVSRFGDRHLSVYRLKGERERGAQCDPGIVLAPADELATEIEEWVHFFERLHILLLLAPALRRRYGD